MFSSDVSREYIGTAWESANVAAARVYPSDLSNGLVEESSRIGAAELDCDNRETSNEEARLKGKLEGGSQRRDF